MPYFDYNATTPLVPVARDAWLQASEESWQNPSSPYRAGVRAGVRLQNARERLAMMLGAEASRVVFTGGATEAIHGILAHLARTWPSEAKLAVSPLEHPAMLAAVGANFRSEQVVSLQVDQNGLVGIDGVDAAIKEGVRGLIMMAANNETGAIMPWEMTAAKCRSAGVVFVCDASQWLGKLPASDLGEADWVVGAGHKFGAPKGVGFLLRPKAENGFVMRPGGSQESGQRGGTEDLASIQAMVAALLEAEQSKVLHESDRVRWRESFESEITRRLPGAKIVAAEAERLWNTVALVMPEGENQRWVALLDKCRVQVSTGSACSSGKAAPSHVLAAMGVPGAEARRVIRISSGWSTELHEWQELADALVAVSSELKPAANVITP